MSVGASQRRRSVFYPEEATGFYPDSNQASVAHALVAVARYLHCYRCFPAVDFDELVDLFDLRGFEKSADAQKVIDEFLERCGYLHVLG